MLARLQPQKRTPTSRGDWLPITFVPRHKGPPTRTEQGKRRRQRTALLRGVACAAALALVLFLLAVVLPALPPWRPAFLAGSGGCKSGQEVVVSLATVAQRLAYPFPAALRSLLRQTAGSCATIWAFVPEGDRAAAEAVVPQLDAAARRAGRVVRLHFVPDRMSSNKFLWAMEALAHPAPGSPHSTAADGSEGSSGGGGTSAWQHSRFQAGGTSWLPTAEGTLVLGLAEGQPQPSTHDLQNDVARLRALPGGPLLFVCDDDFVHHPRLLEVLLVQRATLLGGSTPTGADVQAGGGGGSSEGSSGSAGAAEVAVGTRGYRVRPDFTWGVYPTEFDLHVTEGWKLAAPYRTGVATSGKGILIHPSALARFNLSDFGDAPGGAHFVDDIWLNGHLAAAGVPRWVVPLPAEPADMQVNGDSPLDRRLASQQLSRWQVNSDAIAFFKEHWEPGLLYRFGGVDGPTLRPLPWRLLLRLRSSFTLLLVRAGLL